MDTPKNNTLTINGIHNLCGQTVNYNDIQFTITSVITDDEKTEYNIQLLVRGIDDYEYIYIHRELNTNGMVSVGSSHSFSNLAYPKEYPLSKFQTEDHFIALLCDIIQTFPQSK
jgi:hypothetical protein